MPYGGSNVDEQVVKMSFDNSNFDSNINDSIKALNSLDQRLSIFDNKEHLNNINTSFSNLANTFSIKGQIMFGVLTNLGKEIYSLGKRAFGALTKGIRDGIGEYHTIIESTEAIYQNVKQNGNSLQDVNNALDELNDYADKTIYNFGQMTRMIGMFSSAGVGLKSSVSTIKGLANSAALVGANMQKAQMAWNAVSRAMSSGRFTNVTWRSLELSGIAGKQFNKVITEVARTMKVKGKQTGKDIDGMIKKWGSLRESLREGWLKKDVFTEAMDIMSGALDRDALKQRKYTDKQIDELLKIAEAAEEAATRVKTFKQLMDTIGEAIGSGWAQSFRILLGDLEDAKKLYTRISNVISDFIDNNANIRNELFKQIVSGKDKGVDGKWKTGRDNFRQIIENMLAIVKTFLKSVKTGFYNIFPVDRIAAACRKVLGVIEQFTRAFVIANGKVNKAGETLWNTSDIEYMSESIKDLIKFFRGLASAVDIAWMAISQPIKVIIKRIPFFNDFFNNTNKRIVSLIQRLGDFGDKITGFRDAAKDWEIFGYVTEYVLNNIDELAKKNPVLGAFVWVIRSIQNAIKGVKNGINELGIKPLSALFGIFKMAVTATWRALNDLFGLLQSATSKVDWSWLERPKKVITSILKVFSDYGRGLISFEQAVQKLKQTFADIFGIKLTGADKIATATHKMQEQYSNLNVTVEKTGKKIQSVWEKVKGFFKPVSDYFNNLKNNGELTFDGIAKKIALIGGGVTAAALSISHLAKSFKKINIMNNINNLLTSGIDVLKAYQKQAESKVILNIAIAVGILAGALLVLSFVPYNKLEDGLTIFIAFITTLSMTLSVVINSLTKFNEVLGKSKKELTQFDVLNNLTNRLGQIGLKFAKGFNTRMIGKTFKDIAISILILVGALSALVLLFKFDKDNTVKAIHALAGIIGVLAVSVGVLVAAMNLFSKTATNFAGTFSQFAKLAGVSGIIVSMSLAVLVLVGAMAALSRIEPDRLHTSFVAIGSLVILLGLFSATITAISSSSLNDSKLKKISVRITGAVIAVVAIAAAFAMLVKYIKQYGDKGAWMQALVAIGALITVFTGMMAAMVGTASKIQDIKVFKKLSMLATVMTGSILAIAGAIYILGSSKPIPASVVTTIGILAAATTLILGFMSVTTAAAKGDFSTSFVKVIEGVAFAISAIVVSFGALMAAIAALIASINAVDISHSDADKASSRIVEKITNIATIISKALPELKKLFYSIGQSVGTVFTSFATGFIDMVMKTGDAYKDIADKFVNLIIDIVRKVVETLKTRKDDVAKIIGDLVDFLGTEIAAAINAFFKKDDGSGVADENTVKKWLGGILGVFLGGKITMEVVKNGNALVIAFKNVKDALVAIGKSKAAGQLIGGLKHMGQAVKDFGFIVKNWSTFGAEYMSYNHPIIMKFITALQKLWGGIKSLAMKAASAVKGAGASIISWITAIIAIFVSVTAGIKGAKRIWGNEAHQINTDVKTFGDVLKTMFKSWNDFWTPWIDGFAKAGRIVVAVFVSIGKGILGVVSFLIAGIMEAFSFLIGVWAKIVGFFTGKDSEATKAVLNFKKKVDDVAMEGFGKFGENMFKGVGEAWDIALNDAYNNADFKNIQTRSYSDGEKTMDNYVQGEVNALKDGRKELSEEATKNSEAVINAEKKAQDQHSPSKVSYSIYWNYILGARDALSNGGKLLVDSVKKNNKKINKEAISGIKKLTKNTSLKEVYEKQGVKLDKREGLNKYDISYYEHGNSELKQVEFHRELTEEILRQKDALLGLSEQQAKIYIDNLAYHKAQELGLNDEDARLAETQKIVDYLFGIQEDKTKVLWSSLEALDKATTIGWGEIMSAEEQASKEALENQLKTNEMLMESAEDKKKYIVGKSKEQAKEIIKNDLKAKGLSEEQAEEESKKMIALMVANQKQKKTITADGFSAAVSLMQAETDAYRLSLDEQTKLLEDALVERNKMQANADKMQADVESGKLKLDSPEKIRAYIASKAAADQANGYVNSIKMQIDNIVKNTVAKMQKDGTFNEKKFKEDYEKAYKQANINNKKTKSLPEAINSFFKDVKDRLPGVPDLKTWNYNTGKNKNNLKDDKNKAIKDSKDLKKDLEKNRADLTPTFDLDKLASDANKANGIVMSSLMAAQNASIGDYINKDSELNPFMKDRWQNVYNFTQNNYSPKALSRIDIYRQTQRQLSMSRGF